jgi:hypothetical protein
MSPLTDITAFVTEHLGCGRVNLTVEGAIVTVACQCGARMTRPLDEDRPADGPPAASG